MATTCPSFGAENQYEQQYCGQCGSNLAEQGSEGLKGTTIQDIRTDILIWDRMYQYLRPGFFTAILEIILATAFLALIPGKAATFVNSIENSTFVLLFVGTPLITNLIVYILYLRHKEWEQPS